MAVRPEQIGRFLIDREEGEELRDHFVHIRFVQRIGVTDGRHLRKNIFSPTTCATPRPTNNYLEDARRQDLEVEPNLDARTNYTVLPATVMT